MASHRKKHLLSDEAWTSYHISLSSAQEEIMAVSASTTAPGYSSPTHPGASTAKMAWPSLLPTAALVKEKEEVLVRSMGMKITHGRKLWSEHKSPGLSTKVSLSATSSNNP